MRYLITPASLLMLILALAGCGGGTAQFSLIPEQPSPVPQESGTDSSWPTGLPRDVIQPWEQLDGNGRITPARSSSGINQQSDFTPGVDRFSQNGNVTDNGEASRIESASGGISSVLYRIPYGSRQPGAVSVDANLLSGSGYYLGIADYSTGRWLWHGPFTDNHVRISTARLEPFTSTLGSLYVSVLVHDGAAADVVGIGVNPADFADGSAPAAPTGLSLQPVSGGLLLDWDPVPAGDLAGYRVYHHSTPFINGNAAGVEQLDSLQGSTELELELSGGERRYFRVSALDFSGNESPLSELVSAAALDGAMPDLQLSIEQPSGMLNDSVQLTASGAESYDFDLDGDGIFDLTGSSSGSVQVDTSATGIIRPAVRATGPDETAVALGSISLLIAGNSRPVAEAMATPTSGTAPLEVSFSGSGSTDFDGSIVGGGWDFDGDGAYDVWDDSDIVHVTSAMHTYMEGGVYNARLRVLDDSGAWDVDTLTIVVDGVPVSNVLPVADLQSDVSGGNAPLTVSFDASGSSDGDGGIVEYAWDFDGNGTYEEISDSPLVQHLFSQPGSPLVRLRVEDTDGARAAATLLITVNAVDNAGPLADLQLTPSSGDAPLPVTLDASGSSDLDGSIVRYEWDFDGDGAYDAAGETDSAQHVYNNHGVFNVTLRVTDDMGAQDTDYATLRINEEFDLPHPWGMSGQNPRRTGRSPWIGSQNGNVRFTMPVAPDTRRMPAISADGRTYITDNNQLYAFDKYGNELWKFNSGNSATGTPSIGSDGAVYFGNWGNRFFAVNPDGTERWSINTSGDFRAGSIIGPDGSIYVANLDGRLFARNPDGTSRWLLQMSGNCANCPVLGPDGSVYCATQANLVYAVNPDGTVRWTFPTAASVNAQLCLGPDGTLYVSAGVLHAINPDGTEAWNHDPGGDASGGPAQAADGTIYFGDSAGELTALNPDGSLKWTYTGSGQINSCPAIGADGTVYFGDGDGNFTALKPDASLLWTTSGPGAYSSPVIGPDGTVYSASAGVTYAFGQGPVNLPPTSTVIATPTSGDLPLLVFFDTTGCADPDGSIVLFEWDCDGDGAYESYGTGITHEFTYTSPGIYPATLRVTDNLGSVDVDSLDITVTVPGNASPTADLGADVTSGELPLAVVFDASGSTDPDGSIVLYEWDFDGDGAYDSYGPSSSASHAYNTTGVFTARLRVSDNDGAQATDTLDISVTVTGNTAPTAVIGADVTSGDIPLTVNFNATGSLEPDGSIVLYEWDFDGDGAYDSYGPGDSAAHTYTVGGSYTAKLRVTDDDGAQGTDTLVITANVPGNTPPTAVLEVSQQIGQAGFVAYFDATDSADSDGSIVEYAWDWDGDGNFDSFGGNPLASHLYGQHGSFNATVRVKDDDGATDSSSLQIMLPSEWSQYRRTPQATADSPYTGPQSNNVLWSFAAGGIIQSSAAFGADGTIYFGCNDQNLYALDSDGVFKWTYPLGNPPSRSSPAIAGDGTIYIGSTNNSLHAVNPDGSGKWTFPTGGNVNASPVIDAAGTIYVGSFDGFLYALHPDGSLKWSYDAGSAIRNSAALSPDGTIYINSADSIHAVNQDGSQKWMQVLGNLNLQCPAVAMDGTVYTGINTGMTFSFTPDGVQNWAIVHGAHPFGGFTLDSTGVLYVNRGNGVRAVNPDGSTLWTKPGINAIGSAPAIDAAGNVYFGSNNDNVYALDSSGNEIWSFLTGGDVFSSAAIDRNGRLIIGSDDGNLYCFGAP
ncbi:MAG: PKD domain-containing protein [bacterium]